jgi:hypothetical protein
MVSTTSILTVIAIAATNIFDTSSLGQLVKVIKEYQMNAVVESLIDYIGGDDTELRDVAGLGGVQISVTLQTFALTNLR